MSHNLDTQVLSAVLGRFILPQLTLNNIGASLKVYVLAWGTMHGDLGPP